MFSNKPEEIRKGKDTGVRKEGISTMVRRMTPGLEVPQTQASGEEAWASQEG